MVFKSCWAGQIRDKLRLGFMYFICDLLERNERNEWKNSLWNRQHHQYYLPAHLFFFSKYYLDETLKLFALYRQIYRAKATLSNAFSSVCYGVCVCVMYVVCVRLMRALKLTERKMN